MFFFFFFFFKFFFFLIFDITAKMNNKKKTNWFIEIKKLSEKIEKNEGDKDDILSQIFEIKQDKIIGKIVSNI